MQTIRTTVNFPRDLHQELRFEAFKKRKTLNSVVIEKLYEKRRSKKHRAKNVEKRIKEAFKVFDEVARSGRQDIDLVKALREERDRDNA